MRLLIILFAFSISSVFSQIIFEKTKYDFGDINQTSNRFVYIELINNTAKKAYVLSVKKPIGVEYSADEESIEIGGNLTIRLNVNPKNKGRFSYEVQVFTSDKDEPTTIKLTGNLTVDFKDQEALLQSCPDFSNTKSDRKSATDFELTVITIDKETRELLDSSSVTIIQNGIPYSIFNTDKNGEINQKIPLGFTYFYVDRLGYYSKELGAYVNFKRNKIIVELDKNPESLTAKKPFKVEALEDMFASNSSPKIETLQQIESRLEKKLIQEKVIPIIEENVIVDTTKFKDLDPSNFDEAHFKPINVTFVLDISGSMQGGEKMELMKFSLYQIAEMLRKQDKISIVTYSTETRVDLPPTSGIEKETIKNLIEKLKAGGKTSGGSGIKLGYVQNLNSILKNGVNQVVVITDGAFNRNSDDYQSHIEKYKKMGINLTVVGILNSKQDKATMQKVAELGGGKYISIEKLSDAMNNLKQEIRFISFRR